MRLAIGAPDLSQETLQFAKQLGITYLKVDGTLFLDEKLRGQIDSSELKKAKQLVESYGLKIEVILLPQEANSQFWNVRLGRPERDKEIEDVCKSIGTIGKERIPVIEYVFNLLGYEPGLSFKPIGRGGAITRHFDWNSVNNKTANPEIETSSEEMWDRLTYFLKRIVPASEAAEVRLAVHPDDPPISPLKGDPRILGSMQGMKRLIEVVPSEANGLCFCQGTVAEMGEDVIEAIRYFGSRDKINHVHFRNVCGSGLMFDEAFIDNGDIDMIAAMRAYQEIDYNRTLMPDHWPQLISRSEESEIKPGAAAASTGVVKNLMQDVGASFTLGYIKGIMQTLKIEVE